MALAKCCTEWNCVQDVLCVQKHAHGENYLVHSGNGWSGSQDTLLVGYRSTRAQTRRDKLDILYKELHLKRCLADFCTINLGQQIPRLIKFC